MQPSGLADALRRHQAGDLDAAEAAYREFLGRHPDDADALHLLGVVRHQRGDHERAIDLISRAVARDPSRAGYRSNLGVALRALGRLDEAAAAYGEALRLAPGHVDARVNLGVVLHEGGRLPEAQVVLEDALRQDPGHTEALYNLGNLLSELGEADRAIALYRRARERAPARADILNNLGRALLAAERLDDAVAAFRDATTRDPAHAEAWANLGTVLEREDRVEDAAECYAAAARLRPHEAHWPIRIAALCPSVFPDVGAIDRYRIGLEAVLDAHRAGVRLAPEAALVSGCTPPFNLAHQGRCDRRIKTKFAALFRDAFPARSPRGGGGRPRIGFVEARPHRGMFLRCTAGIINLLEAGRFEVFLFATEGGMPALRAAIRRTDAGFVALPDRLPDAADRVAATGCDVLYYWQIGSDPLNYFLPFLRPAPAQCTSWGTHVTSGVPTVDYYLSSELIEPPGAEAHYSEGLVRLSTLPTYQDPIPPPDPPATRAEFGLPEGAHLYTCLQRPAKFHPDIDALLGGILRRDRHGLVLVLGDPAGRLDGRLRDRLMATIPDVAHRVVALPRRPHPGYLRLLSLTDVALDPPHYGAGGTAYDILGLGLPLVTLPRDRHVGRYALGCYRKMGLMDAVAADPEHYIALAVRLGTDRELRADLVARIRASSPVLFEDHEAVREHERFFERTAASIRT